MTIQTVLAFVAGIGTCPTICSRDGDGGLFELLAETGGLLSLASDESVQIPQGVHENVRRGLQEVFAHTRAERREMICAVDNFLGLGESRNYLIRCDPEYITSVQIHD